MECIDHNFLCIHRLNNSSSALDSYGFLLCNAPSLLMIRAVLAPIQYETPSNFQNGKLFEFEKISEFHRKSIQSVILNVLALRDDVSCWTITSAARMFASDGTLESRGP